MEFADVARASGDAPAQRRPSEPHRFGGDKQGRGKIGGGCERAENRDAGEARDTAWTARTSRRRAQEADDLQQLEHQRQRIHPHRARLIHQREIDGGNQRRDGGANLSVAGFPPRRRDPSISSRVAAKTSTIARVPSAAENARIDPTPSPPSAIHPCSASVVERELARIERPLSLDHRAKIGRCRAGP